MAVTRHAGMLASWIFWRDESEVRYTVYLDQRLLCWQNRPFPSSPPPFRHCATLSSCQSFIDLAPNSRSDISCCLSTSRLWPYIELSRVGPEEMTVFDQRSIPFKGHRS